MTSAASKIVKYHPNRSSTSAEPTSTAVCLSCAIGSEHITDEDHSHVVGPSIKVSVNFCLQQNLDQSS